MDYGGVLGMGGLAGASSEAAAAAVAAAGGLFSSSSSSSPPSLEIEVSGGGGSQRGALASILQKHDRLAEPEEYDWRSLKMARPEALVTAPAKAAPFLLRSSSHHSLFPDGEQMLSFSSASRQSDVVVAADGTLPYYNHPSASASAQSHLRNAGLYPGNPNASMQGVLARVRGPFTPSQWLELEHQALIYKYLDANVPIPTTLLIPIRRSLGASAFPPLSAGSFGPAAWAPFHLGYSGNADPEPGRCRRTDGKKWRCSRDAVADQKYCERHMNRGRHRSRKHVEGQSGHAAKAPNVASSQPASAAPAGSSPRTLSIAQQQSKSSHSNINDPQPVPFNRTLMSKEDQNECVQNPKNLPMLSPANQKPDNNLFPMSKQHNPFEGTSSGANFGLICTDSLLNPPRSSFSDNISCIPTPKLNDQQGQSNPLRHFIDEWPKTQCDHSTVTWPEVEETQSDRTQLSISVPMGCSDFSSSNHDKLALSPLKLSRENEPVHMGLRVGLLDEVCQRQANWRPISWEASMAGPLGEVLTSTNSTCKDQSKNYSSSSLNLMGDGWDSSPRLESSPSGVLQKTSFGSLTSSTGSSPRAENRKIHESTSSLCNDLLGSSTLVNAPTISSL